MPSRRTSTRPPLSASGTASPGRELLAAGTSAILLITYALAFAALIFAGNLKPHLAEGLALLLTSAIVLAAGAALGSAFKAGLTSPQDTTSVLLALIAAAVIQAPCAPEKVMPTMVAAFAIASLATGVVFLGLGQLRLSSIVRFIPYPVVGGFLAGTGWLLVQGAIAVLSGKPLALGTVGALFTGDALLRWVPGVVFGAVITLAVRRLRLGWILPAAVLLGVVAFYAALGASGHPVEDASARGLLLGPFEGGPHWPTTRFHDLAQIDGALLLHNVGVIVALTVLASISMLLKASRLEVVLEHELDLDRELRVTGAANLIAGALGAPPGYLALTESTLNDRIGARGRAPGLLSALACLVILAFGQGALAYVPRAVLGGILFFLGLTVLLEAIYDAWFRLPHSEYALVVLILGAVVTLGFLQGVGLGIVISAVLFALNYARINVVKHVFSGAVLRSKASRAATDEALLEALGGQIYVLKLQGYLFFGTAYNLLTRVQKRMSSSDPTRVRYVVLDFRHVDGIDSSAVLSFVKMRKLAEAQRVTLVFTALPRGVKKQMERGGVVDAPTDAAQSVLIFPDWDLGMEWCEDQILGENSGSLPPTEVMAREEERRSRHDDLVLQLARYLERVEVAQGDEIFHQGETSNDLYVIESGEVAAWLTIEKDREKRLRAMGPGSVVGEAGIYLAASRSATVRATRPTVLHRLSMVSLQRMTREAPELAAAFHRYVARLLAERVVNTTTEAQMVFY